MKKNQTASPDDSRGRASLFSRFMKWIEKGRREAPLCSSCAVHSSGTGWVPPENRDSGHRK